MEITSSQLPPTMELPVVNLRDLHSHCSDMLFFISNDPDSKKRTGLSFLVGMHQYLDNPKKKIPICKLNWTWQIMERIRVTFFAVPTHIMDDSEIVSIGVSWLEAVTDTCDNVKAKTGSSVCVHCLLKDNYLAWKNFFPYTGDLSYDSLRDLLLYRVHLLNYEGSLNYSDVFPAVPLERSSPKENYWKLGRRDFVSIGDVWIDKSIWKVFWLAVRRVYPPIESKRQFGLIAMYSEIPIPSIKLTMRFRVKNKNFNRHVVIPIYANFWSALCWLFDHPPSDCELSTLSPYDWLDGKTTSEVGVVTFPPEEVVD